MEHKREVAVDQIVSGGRVTKFHITIWLLSILIFLVNGYALNIYGVVVTPMMDEIGMDTVRAGMIGSYFFYGMVIGSLLAGFVMSKIGPKKTVIICGCITAITFFIMGTTKSVTIFTLVRIISGVSVAGILPAALSIPGDWAPQKSRGWIMTTTQIGTSVGSVFVSLAGAVIMNQIGWRAMFLIELVILVALIPFAIFVPEPITYQIKKGDTAKIRILLERANPDFQSQDNDVYELSKENEREKASYIWLFKGNRLGNTILFTLIGFLNFFLIFGIQTWLPSLMMNMGYEMTSSFILLLLFNLGGAVGVILVGAFTKKIGMKRILSICYIITGVLVACLALRTGMSIACIILFIIGFTHNADVCANNTYSTSCYPLPLRQPMAGWMLGITRFGSSLGPSIGGLLLANAAPSVSFIVFGVVAIISMILTNATVDRSAESIR